MRNLNDLHSQTHAFVAQVVRVFHKKPNVRGPGGSSPPGVTISIGLNNYADHAYHYFTLENLSLDNREVQSPLHGVK